MLILEMIGNQSEEDLSFLSDDNAVDYVKKITNPKKKSKLRKLFPNTDPALIQLLEGLL